MASLVIITTANASGGIGFLVCEIFLNKNVTEETGSVASTNMLPKKAFYVLFLHF